MTNMVLETPVIPEQSTIPPSVLHLTVEPAHPVAANEPPTITAAASEPAALPPTAKPKMAADKLIGFNGRSLAITAALTAAPMLIRTIVRPKSKRQQIILSIATGLASWLPANYMFRLRPQMRYWGATVDEANQTLAGDELVPKPTYTYTFANTINAPASKVWPWLVQMGQDKGGFYSYAWLENRAGLHIHNAERIVPEWQNTKLGDPVRLAPGEAPPMQVAVFEPERAMVLLGGAPTNNTTDEATAPSPMRATWAFTLHRVDANTTRLVVRFRVSVAASPVFTLAGPLLLEPTMFIMQRKMMLTIKRLAERME